jgi:hypothetical protein
MKPGNVLRKITLLCLIGTLGVLITLAPVLAQQPADPLPSWNDGPAKQAILDFVKATTDQASPKFVPPAERIAVFDNDGTLWVEHPMYTQLAFALDRVKALAPKHSEWREKPPFKDVLDNNLPALAASGKRGLMELIMATHAGMTTQEFEKTVQNWLATARHPRFKRPYTELVYQPMLELLSYLRANGFKTFIVSGGGIEFMRPWTGKIYGVPPEQVVGSSIKTKYELQEGKPVIVRLPELDFIDDKAGKPVGINKFIGRRPLAAFGNSDGDRQMLEYTGAGDGARLMMLVLHDDGKRGYAYGPAQGLPDTKVGAFTQALYDEAKKKGWVIISMKKDWKKIFAWE